LALRCFAAAALPPGSATRLVAGPPRWPSAGVGRQFALAHPPVRPSAAHWTLRNACCGFRICQSPLLADDPWKSLTRERGRGWGQKRLLFWRINGRLLRSARRVPCPLS